MKRTLLLTLLLPLFLGSCAELQVFNRSYREPLEGPTALVRFSTNGQLTAIPNRNCTDFSAQDAGVAVAHRLVGGPAYNGRKIGVMGEAPPHLSSGEMKVAAGKPLTMIFDSEIDMGITIYTCKYSFSFLPKADDHYQITVNHTTSPHACAPEATRLNDPAQRVTLYRAEACK